MQQVYYITYPCNSRETHDWWAIHKTKAKNSFNIYLADIGDDNIFLNIDVYQEDDIANPFVVQANEELDTPICKLISVNLKY